MARRDEDIGDWIEAEATGGGLAVVGWGLGSVAAFVLAFASWQYASPRPVATETARAEASLPDPTEITGSIALSDRGQTTVQPSRIVGAARVAPMPLAANETVATSRDIDQLRSELRDIQRRISQIGMSGDGVSRRIDRIEERVTDLSMRDATATANSSLQAKTDPSAIERSAAERLAERLPTPQPRPDLPSVTVPVAAFDAEGPTTTGAVPKTARADVAEAGEAKPGKAEASTKANRAAATLPAIAPQPMPAPAPPPPAATAPAPMPVVTTAPPLAPAASMAAASPNGPAPAPNSTASAPPVATEEPAAAPVRVVAVAPPAVEPPPAPPPAMATPEAPVPVPATKPAQAPATKGAAIDLGGFRTLASLRRSWADTTVRYGDMTKGLEPLARLRETDSGMEARLLAGPFADQTEAAKACFRLKAAGATCTVTTYAGQPIAGLR